MISGKALHNLVINYLDFQRVFSKCSLSCLKACNASVECPRYKFKGKNSAEYKTEWCWKECYEKANWEESFWREGSQGAWNLQVPFRPASLCMCDCEEKLHSSRLSSCFLHDKAANIPGGFSWDRCKLATFFSSSSSVQCAQQTTLIASLAHEKFFARNVAALVRWPCHDVTGLREKRLVTEMKERRALIKNCLFMRLPLLNKEPGRVWAVTHPRALLEDWFRAWAPVSGLISDRQPTEAPNEASVTPNASSPSTLPLEPVWPSAWPCWEGACKGHVSFSTCISQNANSALCFMRVRPFPSSSFLPSLLSPSLCLASIVVPGKFLTQICQKRPVASEAWLEGITAHNDSCLRRNGRARRQWRPQRHLSGAFCWRHGILPPFRPRLK